MKNYKLTKREREICRVIGATWVSRNEPNPYIADFVTLWENKPNFSSNSFTGFLLASVTSNLFPSLKAGECISVEEQINETI